MPATTTGRISFYHRSQSRAAIVHWMLEEIGAEYEIRRVDLQQGENRKPECLAINPDAGLPQLRQGAVIDEYIARCRERPADARTMGAR